MNTYKALSNFSWATNSVGGFDPRRTACRNRNSFVRILSAGRQVKKKANRGKRETLTGKHIRRQLNVGTALATDFIVCVFGKDCASGENSLQVQSARRAAMDGFEVVAARVRPDRVASERETGAFWEQRTGGVSTQCLGEKFRKSWWSLSRGNGRLMIRKEAGIRTSDSFLIMVTYRGVEPAGPRQSPRKNYHYIYFNRSLPCRKQYRKLWID